MTFFFTVAVVYFFQEIFSPYDDGIQGNPVGILQVKKETLHSQQKKIQRMKGFSIPDCLDDSRCVSCVRAPNSRSAWITRISGIIFVASVMNISRMGLNMFSLSFYHL